jgi:F1F0 ATPase subunit 2
MMIAPGNIILSFIAGIILGGLFFWGLWFTVKQVAGLKYAAAWVSFSSLLRTAIALMGFYFVANGSWQRLLICVLGFIGARFMTMWLTKSFDRRQLPINNADPS